MHTRLLASALIVLMTTSVPAQELVRLTGGIGLSSDAFMSSGEVPLGQPTSIHRASINLNLTLLDQIAIPFDAYVSSLGSGYSQPFNQFGIHPRLGNWLTVHAGYFTKNISSLSFGDARILGGGIDFTPDMLRVSVFHGATLLAREADSTVNFNGDYLRRVTGLSVGYTENGSTAKITLMQSSDDAESIRRTDRTRTPQANLISTISFETAIEDIATISGEVGVSFFTFDTQAEVADPEDRNRVLETFVAWNASSSYDYGGRLGLGFTINENVSVQANAQWLGPGYVTLGFVNLFNDMFDVTLSPSLRLFESALMIQATIGQRVNNLRSQRETSTTQLIGNFNVTAYLSEHASIDASYSNFGLRNTNRNDTLRISNINDYLSVTPRFTYRLFDVGHTVSVNVFRQKSEDLNQFTRLPYVNENLSYGATYGVTLRAPWTFMVNANRMSGTSNDVTTDVTSINGTASTRVLDDLISVSATLGLNTVNAIVNSTQAFTRISATAMFDAYGQFTVLFTTNSFDYAASGALARTDMMGSVQYSVSF